MKLPIVRQLGLIALACLLWGGCSKHKADDNTPSALSWQNVTITIGNKKHVVEVGRFAKPVQVAPIENGTLPRETPLDTWNSWQSLSITGRDEKDLKTYADFYTIPQAFLSRLKSAPAQFFDDARKADERPAAVAIVKTGTYQAVVYSVRRSTSYRAAIMVNRNGKYAIDDEAKLKDPVLRELAAGGYQIVKEHPTTQPGH